MEPLRFRITIRRAASFAGLAALLSVVAFCLSQCRIVDDRLTGVRLTPLRNSTPNCIVQCQNAAQQAQRSESALHVTRVRACASDPACLAAEEERHEAAVESIKAARKACVDRCHHQGGGRSGD